MASTDDAETNRRFAEANDADFPILADPDKMTAAAYGVLAGGAYAQRWTFYIDAQGKIADIDKAVSAVTAGPDLAKRLEQLDVPTR